MFLYRQRSTIHAAAQGQCLDADVNVTLQNLDAANSRLQVGQYIEVDVIMTHVTAVYTG